MREKTIPNSPKVTEAARVMSERFAEMLQRSYTQSEVNQVIDDFISNVRNPSTRSPSKNGLEFLRSFCQATFRMMSRGQHPGRLIERIDTTGQQSYGK